MRPPFPDLLSTRAGRLTVFFLLYMTEGIPLGFTATAVATQMRRQGLGPEAIGAPVASLHFVTQIRLLTGIIPLFVSPEECITLARKKTTRLDGGS